MPPKARELTEEEKAQVEALASVLTSGQIADYLGVARTTFYDIMARDFSVSERYKKGRAKALGAVAQGLLKKAMAGDNTAAIFYLKTQGGWSDNLGSKVNIDLSDCSSIPDKLFKIVELTAKGDISLKEAESMASILKTANQEDYSEIKDQILELQEIAKNGG